MSETALLLGEDQMVEEAWIVSPTELGREGWVARWKLGPEFRRVLY